MQIFNLFKRDCYLFNSIGERIKYIRKQLNLTQQDLARRLGLKSKVSISDYEKGKRNPSLDELVILSRIAHRTIDWLITGMDEHDPIILKQLRQREQELEEVKKINYELIESTAKLKAVADKSENYGSRKISGN